MHELNKTIIYCRIASVKQENDGNKQEQVCRDWCANNGLSVERVFIDNGASGASADRPALQEMLGFLSETQDKHIVVATDAARFARDLNVYSTIRSAINKSGHQMQIAKDPYDPNGQDFIIGFSVLIAEHEGKMHSERIKAGLVRHKARMQNEQAA